jgi:hypothetical protein
LKENKTFDKKNKNFMRKETMRGKSKKFREEKKIEIRRKGKKELRIESLITEIKLIIRQNKSRKTA